MCELGVQWSVGGDKLRQYGVRMAVAMVAVCVDHPVHCRTLRIRLVRLSSGHPATALAPAQWAAQSSDTPWTPLDSRRASGF
jgi:hypothetical protein